MHSIIRILGIHHLHDFHSIPYIILQHTGYTFYIFLSFDIIICCSDSFPDTRRCLHTMYLCSNQEHKSGVCTMVCEGRPSGEISRSARSDTMFYWYPFVGGWKGETVSWALICLSALLLIGPLYFPDCSSWDTWHDIPFHCTLSFSVGSLARPYFIGDHFIFNIRLGNGDYRSALSIHLHIRSIWNLLKSRAVYQH